MKNIICIDSIQNRGEVPDPPPVTPTRVTRKAANQYTLASAVTRVVRLDETIRTAAEKSGEIAPYRTEAVIRSLARLGAEKLDSQHRSLRSFVTTELRRAS